ncbi:MAG TPA: FHA domain-containing protein [Ktedonobacteraceae bacterium]|nr:FHA domain-containing protein [Ktedonobacteraceae bacterium]
MEAVLNGPSGRINLGPGEITVGRLADNKLVVNDPKASSHHAIIRPAGQGYSITDLGSTNGTFVNERKLSPNSPTTLNPGDKIRIGDTTYSYEVVGAAPIAPTVYGGPGGLGYDPTVAAPSPYANNPSYLPTEAAASPYSQYEASPPPAYQPPLDYQAPPVQQPYAAPPPPAYSPYGAPAAQPAYGAAVGAVPGAGAPPARQSRRTLWIVLGVVGVVIVLAILLFAVVAANASTPTKTLDTFCNAIKNRDYQTAYNQLSSFRQTQISEADFANFFSSATSCSYSTPAVNGSSATTTLTFFTNSGSVNGATNMVQENGTWKIDAINFPTQ